MSAPPAVLAAAADRSGLDPRQGRHARAGVCGRCGAPVLRGLDADRCAGQAVADPWPLTPAGEAVALLSDRLTYEASGRPLDLWLRDRWQIASHPADSGLLVVAQHVCGAGLEPYRRFIPPPPPPRTRSSVPPF